MMRWFDMSKSLTKPEVLMAAAAGGLSNQHDPQSMIDAFVRIAEEESSKFRNVVPDSTAEWIKGSRRDVGGWQGRPIWSSPPVGWAGDCGADDGWQDCRSGRASAGLLSGRAV
jgi:hypothetical protein